VIPAALRRLSATRRGLSVRLRAEARVLRGLCVEAEAAGHGGHEVERVAHYCEVLEGWCLGERSGADLAGAINAVSSAVDRGAPLTGANTRQMLLRAACALAEDRAHWCAYPTHLWPDLTRPEPNSRDLWRTGVLCNLRKLYRTSQGREVWETLYRAQAEELFALSRTPNRFAALDAMEGR